MVEVLKRLTEARGVTGNEMKSGILYWSLLLKPGQRPGLIEWAMSLRKRREEKAAKR